MTENAEKMPPETATGATTPPQTAPAAAVNKDQKPTEKQPVSDLFAKIVEDQQSTFPAVTAEFAQKIDSATAAADRQEHNQRRRKDSSGVFFDPELHQTDENGEPQKTVKGLWVMKRGRKRSEGKTRLRLPRDTSQKDEPAADPAADALQISCDTAAEQTAAAFWAGMMALFGKNGAPDEAEACSLPPALSAYYQSRGVAPQLPAWAPPAIIMTTAVTRRLQQDDTMKARIKTAAVGLWSKARQLSGRMF